VTDVADYAAFRLNLPAVRTSDSRVIPYVRAFHAGVSEALALTAPPRA
jgi:hypothetical protein